MIGLFKTWIANISCIKLLLCMFSSEWHYFTNPLMVLVKKSHKLKRIV